MSRDFNPVKKKHSNVFLDLRASKKQGRLFCEQKSCFVSQVFLTKLLPWPAFPLEAFSSLVWASKFLFPLLFFHFCFNLRKKRKQNKSFKRSFSAPIRLFLWTIITSSKTTFLSESGERCLKGFPCDNFSNRGGGKERT